MQLMLVNNRRRPRFMLLRWPKHAGRIDTAMFDIQHDSPVPIHEQLTTQIRVHVASEALKAGAELPEYRAWAQELLTNPQVVAKAYADLEAEGVLSKGGHGAMVVRNGAAIICKLRLQDMARANLANAVNLALACGLDDAAVQQAVEQALAAGKNQPLTPEQVLQAMKKPKHEHSSSHRASQGIQDLSRKKGPG
jgi:GntR family transcriptional regulator